MHLLWTCYGLQQVSVEWNWLGVKGGEVGGGGGWGGMRDGDCCKCGIVDVWLAYFSLLLLRGTAPFPLWCSSLLAVCLAEWFHMEEHISAASAAQGDQTNRSEAGHVCSQQLPTTVYKCSGQLHLVSGLDFTYKQRSHTSWSNPRCDTLVMCQRLLASNRKTLMLSAISWKLGITWKMLYRF